MGFPASPSNGDYYTTPQGTLYQYDSTDDKWNIVSSSSPFTSLDYNHYILLQQRESDNVAAGGVTAATWNIRTINTEVVDIGNHCSLSSNQFTLEAGTYYIRASAPTYACARHRIKLYNVSDTSDTLFGRSCMSHQTYGGAIHAQLNGTFTITSSKTFEIRHYTQLTRGTDGMGLEVNSGDQEIYTEVELWKVG